MGWSAFGRDRGQPDIHFVAKGSRNQNHALGIQGLVKDSGLQHVDHDWNTRRIARLNPKSMGEEVPSQGGRRWDLDLKVTYCGRDCGEEQANERQLLEITVIRLWQVSAPSKAVDPMVAPTDRWSA
jgi:hypothetical protein